MEDERPKEQFEFLRAVFREPTTRLWLRSQYVSPLTADPGGGCLENKLSSKTVASRELAVTTTLPLELAFPHDDIWSRRLATWILQKPEGRSAVVQVHSNQHGVANARAPVSSVPKLPRRALPPGR
jgi:hypothetical protein